VGLVDEGLRLAGDEGGDGDIGIRPRALILNLKVRASVVLVGHQRNQRRRSLIPQRKMSDTIRVRKMLAIVVHDQKYRRKPISTIVTAVQLFMIGSSEGTFFRQSP